MIEQGKPFVLFTSTKIQTVYVTLKSDCCKVHILSNTSKQGSFEMRFRHDTNDHWLLKHYTAICQCLDISNSIHLKGFLC